MFEEEFSQIRHYERCVLFLFNPMNDTKKKWWTFLSNQIISLLCNTLAFAFALHKGQVYNQRGVFKFIAAIRKLFSVKSYFWKK